MGVPRAQGASSQRESSHFVLSYKKLAQGRFRFVSTVTSTATAVEMDAAELSLILEGIDLSEAKRRKRFRMIPKAA